MTVDNIAESKQWLALLHINENNNSEISDINFYISKQTNPKLELEELLRQQSCDNVCKYPARYKYLSDNLDLNISFEHCDDLQSFLVQSRGETASLVFASSFLGSPTSYFGHTFIKINKPKNTYFSQTLSYAAEMPQKTGLSDLIYKGISGEFVGKYVVSPYFKLTEGYNIIEQRTLYEYELDLSKDEIEIMLWHSYEMIGTNIPYKFFTENCAYEIFWLLDVARPNANLRSKLKTYVVPYETVEVLKNEKMVKNTIVRNPLIENLYKIYSSLSSEEQLLFSIWKDSKNKIMDLENLNISSETKNKFKQLINGYYDILFKKFRTSKADFNDVKKLSFNKTEENITNDFEPKKAHKISFGALNKDGISGQSFTMRPALFDRYEERDNLLSESSLEFLNLGFTRTNDNAKLEHFDVVKMESLNKRFDFYQPTSWRFYAGANRSYGNDNLEAVAELGFGLTKGNEYVSIFGLGQIAIYPFVSSINIQALAGLSIWINKGHLNFDYKETFRDGIKPKDEMKYTFLYPINKSFSFRLSNELKQKEKIVALEYKF